jgi:NitT/TauT family transport system substrate-binding protein
MIPDHTPGRTRRIVLVATALLILLTAIVAVVVLRPPPAPPGGPERITIAQWGTEKYLIYLPVYICQEKGLFAGRGLDVSIVYSGNDDQVFATVARGDAQFGVGDPIFAAVSRQRGFDGVVVASIVDRVALWGVSKSVRQYDRPADFAKMSIGTFPRPSTTYTLVKDMIDANKLEGTRIVEVAIGAELAVLDAGQVDLAMLLEPAASIAESKGYHVVTSFPALWGPFAFTGLTTTATYRREHPKVVEAMRAALDDAARLAHDEPVEAAAIARRLFPNLDPAVVNRAVRRMIDEGTIPRTASLAKDGWLRAVEVRQNIGDLKTGSQYLECIDGK